MNDQTVRSQTHHVKIATQYLLALIDGSKTCEVRDNDRDYQRGDILRVSDGTVTRHYLITHVLILPHDRIGVQQAVLSLAPTVVETTP